MTSKSPLDSRDVLGSPINFQHVLDLPLFSTEEVASHVDVNVEKIMEKEYWRVVVAK